jgi:tripartite-type tricarboxylate transporter receptor subunit TctC
LTRKNATAGISLVCLAATLLFYFVPLAAQSYPAKPIRLIVPFAPGGGNDLIARIIGQRLTSLWGQTVIVDNRPGAGGNVAAEITARATPDGHTAFQFNIANTIAASLYKDLRYDPVRDFAPVTQIAATPFILLVHPGMPVKNVAELIAAGKQSPGKWSYGSSGNGGSTHLAMELFKSMTATEFIHVPYGGGGPALNDLVAGRIQILTAAAGVALPQVNAGRLRAIAQTGEKRIALIPDIPTIAESGVPGYESSAWYGLVLPAQAPAAIVTALHDAVLRVLREPEVEQRMATNGMQIVGSTPSRFAAFIRDEVAKWARVVKLAKAVAN